MSRFRTYRLKSSRWGFNSLDDVSFFYWYCSELSPFSLQIEYESSGSGRPNPAHRNVIYKYRMGDWSFSLIVTSFSFHYFT